MLRSGSRTDTASELATNEYGPVVVERSGELVHIRLNRPRFLNAVDRSMADELRRRWREAGDDESLRAVILTGSGPEAFCSGYDTREGTPPQTPVDARGCGFGKALVVAVNGVVRGVAYELLRGADHVLASAHALFIDPPRLAAPSPLKAADARRAGLVHEVVPQAQLHAAAERVARLIAAA